MRTTLNLDEEILETAKSIARDRGLSIGNVISELVRKGLRSERSYVTDDDLPYFQVHESARPITTDDIARAEDEDL